MGNIAEDLNPLDSAPADRIVSDVTCSLGWRDRLKVLIGIPLLVRVEVFTENEVGRTKTQSRAWTPPLFPPRDVEVSDR